MVFDIHTYDEYDQTFIAYSHLPIDDHAHFGASILIGTISVIQYKEEAEDYHTSRLLRKEDQIRAEISYVLSKTSFEVITEKIPIILKEKQDIYRISDVHE
ncbi:hypothetical protein LCGC14_3084480, partial [marine sediment metagenome]